MVIFPPKTLRRALVWFRRDLRVADHPALAHALREAEQVWCVFVLDRAILDGLPWEDRRVAFIRDSLDDLDRQIDQISSGGASLIVRHADMAAEIPRLATQLDV
jgi:deoxyribodipyrimidine photo-lyase